MGGVLEEQAALLERLHHQRYVALFQVTDAAVNQLGAAAGSSFAEVALLQQEHVIPTGGAIDRHAGAGGASAYHDNVPRAGVRFEPAVHLSAVHGPPFQF